MNQIWHESQEIHQKDDGSIIFEAEVAVTQEIKFWVMSWGSHALVLEPEWLREEVRTEVEAMLDRYEREPQSQQSPLRK